MAKITTTDLMNVLANLKGGTIVTLTSLTEVDMPTSFGGKVYKWCKQSMQVGSSYENSVNNRLARNGYHRNFTARGLRWGRWHILNRIIEHNGLYYARFIKVANTNEQVVYFVNGRQATPRETQIIKRYDTLSFSRRQAMYGLTTNQTQVRNYHIENILALTAEGQSYEVVRYSATRGA